MSVESWSILGTVVGTLLLLVVPGLVYTWYALEHMIGDRERYPLIR